MLGPGRAHASRAVLIKLLQFFFCNKILCLYCLRMHVQPQRARRGAEGTTLRVFVFDITKYTHAFLHIHVQSTMTQHRWCSMKLGCACSAIATRGLLQHTHGSQPNQTTSPLKHNIQPLSQIITGTYPAVVKTAGTRRVVARYAASLEVVALCRLA